MSRRHLFRVVTCALVFAAGGLSWAAPAPAQSGPCPDSGGMLASVTIDRPARNSTVSGLITVQGSAQAGAGLTLDRVEVSVGGLSKVYEPGPRQSIDFNLPFDVSALDPGSARVRVVACSTSLLTTGLLRGEDSFNVTVERVETPTTSVDRSPTTLAGPGVPRGATPPSVLATTTTRPGQVVVGQTTVTSSVPPSTEPRVEVFTPEPVRPQAAEDSALVLTEAPAGRSPRPPLWVGAVVGISGALGLGFSAASWRRRPHAPPPAEPIDPDLVEVG